MIQPISFTNNSNLNFKGQIRESEILTKALKNFSKEELAEFNALKKRAAKVKDDKIFALCVGCKTKVDNMKHKDEFYSYTQLHEESNRKFYPEEIYKIAIGDCRNVRDELTVLDTDNSAFARAILNPLREEYGEKKKEGFFSRLIKNFRA